MKRVILTSLGLVIFVSSAANAYTLNEQDYLRQNINFLGDESIASCTASSSGRSLAAAGGDHILPSEATQMLDNEEVKQKVEANKERYLYAEEKTGVPWQVMAALHYREGGLGSDRSITNGEPLRDGTNVDGARLHKDPNLDAENAAKLLLRNALAVYKIDLITADSPVEDIGNAFLAYNRGFMYQKRGATFVQSPYVMNYYDEQYIAMEWIHADSYDPQGKKLNDVMGKVDARPGALTVLHYIGGLSLGGINCVGSSQLTGPIIEVAQTLAWPRVLEAGLNKESDAKPAYRDAVKEYNPGVLSRAHKTNTPYADCGIFVATTMRASGADPSFPEVWTKRQKEYMQGSNKYKITNNPNASDLEPGDILVYHKPATNEGHIMFYAGDIEGDDPSVEYQGIDASLNRTVPGYKDAGYMNYMIKEADFAARLISQ